MKNLAAALVVSLAAVCQAATIEGKVVAVSDGDTVTVLDAARQQHIVRLAGIDAPERRQPFGQRSKQSLSEMIFGQNVLVMTGKRDRYGRQIGTILLGQRNVNLEQLRRGMAWFYRRYASELPPGDRAAYDEAEFTARLARKGLWSDQTPVPPWSFRRANSHP